MIVFAARWQSRTGDIAIRPLKRHQWQIEGAGGWEKASWQKSEVPEALARPGQVLQTWIGLHPVADEVEVRRRYVTGRLGSLVVPLKVAGRDEEQVIHL